MPTINLELKDKKAKSILKLLTQYLTGSERLMAGIANELLAHTERNFQQQGRPKWPALAPSTQKARARKGHGATSPILRGRAPNLVRNFIIEFSDQHAAIKNPTNYAAIHQFGGRAGRGLKVAIPARPFLPVKADKKTLTPEMQQSLNKLLKAYLKKAASA